MNYAPPQLSPEQRLECIKAKIVGLKPIQFMCLGRDHPDRDALFEFCKDMPNIEITDQPYGLEIFHP